MIVMIGFVMFALIIRTQSEDVRGAISPDLYGKENINNIIECEFYYYYYYYYYYYFTHKSFDQS